MTERVTHTIEPVCFGDSRVLILGTMPSVKSREIGFYYGHPQNRFWKVLSAVLGEPLPQLKQDKIDLLHRHHIALWDVVKSCDIEGSADSSISDPVSNDIAGLIKNTQITKIFTTGATAYKLYERLCEPKTGIKAICLPSTSPANAKMNVDQLCEKYRAVAQAVGGTNI